MGSDATVRAMTRPQPRARPTSYSRVSLGIMAHASEANLLGNVHGGEIMKLADSTAGAVAHRHSGGPAVTAAMDEMTFLAPVHVGDIIKTYAQVNWAGRSSMEIGVRVEAQPWGNASDEPRARRQRLLRLRRHRRRGAPAPGAAAGDRDRRVTYAASARPRSAARTGWRARREIDEGREE